MLSRRTLLFAALAPDDRGMAKLPGGTFRMGADVKTLEHQFPAASEGVKSMLRTESPAHQVTIAPFQMDRCAVTNSQFQRFTESRREWRKESRTGDYLRHWQENDRFPERSARVPVVFVSWDAAVAYAEWMGKRLPSEAEWEFAARGGLNDPQYPWGNDEPTPMRANYGASGVRGPLPVGSYPPNPYGIYDLVGNVWQFCLDPWTAYPADPITQSEDDLRRMRNAGSERRSIRGGSFDGNGFNLRVTARDSHKAGNPVAHVGFRCAQSG